MNKEPAVRAIDRNCTLCSFAQKCHSVQCARDVGVSLTCILQCINILDLIFLSEILWYYDMKISP